MKILTDKSLSQYCSQCIAPVEYNGLVAGATSVSAHLGTMEMVVSANMHKWVAVVMGLTVFN